MADVKSTLCGIFPNTKCVNTKGGYRCDCIDGWTSSSEGCVDIDECLAGNSKCDENASCTNVEGSKAFIKARAVMLTINHLPFAHSSNWNETLPAKLPIINRNSENLSKNMSVL